MVRTILSLLLSVAVLPSWAHAEVLFEGYAKVLSGDQHIGYIISRYEFDEKKKLFSATYFLKTNAAGSDITESLKALADSELAPISYEYTSVVGKDTKTIDAKFKNGTMTALVKASGKPVDHLEKKIPKGTFLSTFLVYLILKSKDGLKADTKYDYQAIAEEDGAIEKGTASVEKEEVHNGIKAFKISNTFKDSKFLSYVTAHGEVLGTDAVAQGVSTQLVATAAEAEGTVPVSQGLLKTIFGTIPTGQGNVVATSKPVATASPVPAATTTPVKAPAASTGKPDAQGK